MTEKQPARAADGNSFHNEAGPMRGVFFGATCGSHLVPKVALGVVLEASKERVCHNFKNF